MHTAADRRGHVDDRHLVDVTQDEHGPLCVAQPGGRVGCAGRWRTRVVMVSFEHPPPGAFEGLGATDLVEEPAAAGGDRPPDVDRLGAPATDLADQRQICLLDQILGAATVTADEAAGVAVHPAARALVELQGLPLAQHQSPLDCVSHVLLDATPSWIPSRWTNFPTHRRSPALPPPRLLTQRWRYWPTI